MIHRDTSVFSLYFLYVLQTSKKDHVQGSSCAMVDIFVLISPWDPASSKMERERVSTSPFISFYISFRVFFSSFSLSFFSIFFLFLLFFCCTLGRRARAQVEVSCAFTCSQVCVCVRVCAARMCPWPRCIDLPELVHQALCSQCTARGRSYRR